MKTTPGTTKQCGTFLRKMLTSQTNTLIQNDRKNFVLFYHLQFQDKFMHRQVQVVGSQELAGGLQGYFLGKNDQGGDQQSSTPIIVKEESLKQDSSVSNNPAQNIIIPPEQASSFFQQKFPSLPSGMLSKDDQQNEPKTQLQKKQSCQQINQKFNPCEQKLMNDKISNQDISKRDLQNISENNQIQVKKYKKRKNQKRYFYDQDDLSDVVETFKFPFLNQYIRQHSDQYLKTLDIIEKTRQQLGKTINDTFINCDVRYFNWNLFIDEVGKFDVTIIDPPWRIKGAQQNDSQFMFSNCKFSLEYNTMANSEIGRIPLHLLSDQGFIFVWILNSQLDASVEIMEGWGYELIQQIVWVKLKDEKINLTHGYYFMHSYEVCLVGYKCKKNVDAAKKIKMRQKISWNTIFSQVRQKSQKPEDLYAIIDIMFKGGKKIQIFARNHNLRFGLFSMGNELGESYDKWLLKLSCDKCKNVLKYGQKRFKSKIRPNYDLCSKCIGTEDRSTFFELANSVDENVRHQYVSCNHCGTQPIWGLRFQCITCQDFDLCENCYDKNLHVQHNFHSLEHEFMFLQVPVFGNGFHIHQSKCSSCYQNPIIGIYFSCSFCKNFKLCQKCYFERPPGSYYNSNKRHKPSHQLEVIFEPQIQQDKIYECFGCKVEILEHCWMCENCYNFFFCEKCYNSRTEFKSLYANTHKNYHVLTKIF